MALVISGATIIDGNGDVPLEGQLLWIEGARIKAIGRRDELAVPADVMNQEVRVAFAANESHLLLLVWPLSGLAKLSCESLHAV